MVLGIKEKKETQDMGLHPHSIAEVGIWKAVLDCDIL